MTPAFAVRATSTHIEVTYTTSATLADHLQAVKRVAVLAAEHPHLGVLIDRSSAPLLSSGDERTIANAVKHSPTLRETRIALLAPAGASYGLARVQQTIADLQGLTMYSFSRLDEALAWLIGS